MESKLHKKGSEDMSWVLNTVPKLVSVRGLLEWRDQNK